MKRWLKIPHCLRRRLRSEEGAIQQGKPLHIPTPDDMRRAPNFNRLMEEEMAEKTFESEVMAALKAQSDLINTMSNGVSNLTSTLTNLQTTLTSLEAALTGLETALGQIQPGSTGGPTIADIVEGVKAVETATTSIAANVVELLAQVTPAPDAASAAAAGTQGAAG